MTGINFKKIALAHMSSEEVPGVDFHLINITPDLAKEMLTYNAIGQRNPSGATIDRYESDIMVGAWKMAGDPIRFSHAGQLIDGQHRLAAISVGDVDVINLVITGLDPDIMAAIDTGRRRSLADLINIEHEGIKNAKTIGGILNRLWYYEKADCFYLKNVSRKASASTLSAAVPSFSTLIDTMHRWEGKVGTSLEQAAKWAHMAHGKNPGVAPSVWGAIYMQLSGFDKDVREAIFNELVYEPRSTSMGYPVNALRSRLMKLANNKNERWSPIVQHHFANLIVNALMAGDEVSILRTPPTLAFPHLAELKFHPDAVKNLGIDRTENTLAAA